MRRKGCKESVHALLVANKPALRKVEVVRNLVVELVVVIEKLIEVMWTTIEDDKHWSSAGARRFDEAPMKGCVVL